MLANFTNLLDFIRSGELCKISTGLALFYQTCGLYKVWWSMYNMDQPCMIYQACEKPPAFLDFIWSCRITDFVQHLSALREKYKVLGPLYNIYRPCVIDQTGGVL
jgi:hypothetical protein